MTTQKKEQNVNKEMELIQGKKRKSHHKSCILFLYIPNSSHFSAFHLSIRSYLAFGSSLSQLPRFLKISQLSLDSNTYLLGCCCFICLWACPSWQLHYTGLFSLSLYCTRKDSYDRRTRKINALTVSPESLQRNLTIMIDKVTTCSTSMSTCSINSLAKFVFLIFQYIDVTGFPSYIRYFIT